MTPDPEDPAEWGRDVGARAAETVAELRATAHRWVRRMRWVDGGVLLLLLLLGCLGVWWPWATAYFVVAFAIDLYLCRRLNPARSTPTVKDDE